jgi:hypothetical protein
LSDIKATSSLLAAQDVVFEAMWMGMNAAADMTDEQHIKSA